MVRGRDSSQQVLPAGKNCLRRQDLEFETKWKSMVHHRGRSMAVGGRVRRSREHPRRDGDEHARVCCAGFVDWGQAVETDPAASNNLWQPTLAPDGIHSNTDGYQRMAKAAKAVLQALKAKMKK